MARLAGPVGFGYGPARVLQAPGLYAMNDSGLQRLNMVESQVRTSDVTDRRIIRAMLDIPREPFVPAGMVSLAYSDAALAVSGQRTGSAPVRALLEPRTLAKLIQLADIDDDETVLDVGCATGYSSAVLARIAKRVVAIEADKALADAATAALKALGIANVTVVNGELKAGAPAQAPFDVILLNGAVPAIPQALCDQLREGGRLVAVVSQGRVSRAHLALRTGSTVDTRPAFEVAADALPGFEAPAGFVF
jgi:protein-L-isoaspartate(D-aspartate) O-methyltransferase